MGINRGGECGQTIGREAADLGRGRGRHHPRPSGSWIAGEADPAPYIIVTTLPSETIDWKLRYTAEGKYNHGH
jgi:hypothetical protein